MDVKGGPTYMIDFVANLTQPEITLSTELVDFEKVLLNTRKTIKVRVMNEKEVPCDWWYIE